MRFANLSLLPYLILILIIFTVFVVYRNIKFNKVNFSNILSMKKLRTGMNSLLVLVPDILKIAAVILLAVALLRPQDIKKQTQEKIKGIDILIALDISGSMQAEDLEPNRLEAAKDVCREFINGLSNDRVGLVVFAGKSFTQCPLTVDYEIVKTFIDQVDLQTIRIDGTAIGEAVLTSINRLESSGASKVVILTTDGVNNRGIAPLEAAKIAAYKDVKVYTIGIGKKGGSPMMYTDRWGIKRRAFDRRTGRKLNWEEPDEKTLRQMAKITGGKYFRAENKKELNEIYKIIGKMEKQEIKVKTYNKYEDKFFAFLLAGFLLLAAALLMEVFKVTRVIA